MGCSNANHRPGGFRDAQIKEHAMKTTIKTDHAPNYVTISYDDCFGDRVTRTFFCPASGGYIRESVRDYPQVCDQLAHSGSTLYAESGNDLIKIIRREYRSMRRAEKREATRYL